MKRPRAVLVRREVSFIQRISLTVSDWTNVWRLKSIHIIHPAMTMAAAALLVLLGGFGDQGVAGEQQRRDAGGVLQGGAGDLRRVDDAGLDQVFVDVGRGVVAVVAFALRRPSRRRCRRLGRRCRRSWSAASGRRGGRCCSRPSWSCVRSSSRASAWSRPAAGRRRRRGECLLRRPRGWRAGRLRRGPSSPSFRSRSRRRR